MARWPKPARDAQRLGAGDVEHQHALFGRPAAVVADAVSPVDPEARREQGLELLLAAPVLVGRQRGADPGFPARPVPGTAAGIQLLAISLEKLDDLRRQSERRAEQLDHFADDVVERILTALRLREPRHFIAQELPDAW